MSERIIKTGLGPRYKDMLDAVIGQMSDGYWENTPMMRGYWKFVTTGTSGNEVTLNVDAASGARDGDRHIDNRFYGMSDDAVKKFFADKIKFLIKEEGLGKWDRGNEATTDYLSYHDPYRVKDCYYAYEVLKGRNARKHPEYGDVEEAKKSSPKREKGGTDDDSIESRLVYVGRVTGEYSDGLAWDLANMTRQIRRIRLRVIELLDKFDEASDAGDDDALVEIADELKAFATSEGCKHAEESKQPVKIKLVEKAKNAVEELFAKWIEEGAAGMRLLPDGKGIECRDQYGTRIRYENGGIEFRFGKDDAEEDLLILVEAVTKHAPARVKHDRDYIYITCSVTPEEGVKLLNAFFDA